MSDDMKTLRDNSYLAGSNAEYLEQLYDIFLTNPETLDKYWQAYFAGLAAGETQADTPLKDLREQFRAAAKAPVKSAPALVGDAAHIQKQMAVMQLIHDYRSYGHQLADLDPLKQQKRHDMPRLTLAYHGLSDADLDQTFQLPKTFPVDQASLRDIVKLLKNIYCSTIGVEYMHISDAKEIEWLQDRIEHHDNRQQIAVDEKKSILKQLVAASELEKYLGRKYVGQKRFSLEGGDSLIPAVNAVIQRSGELGVKELVMGMSHRGRLNVLMNVLGKASRDLFNEFEGVLEDEDRRSGDVKYHLGFSSNVETPGGVVHLSLAFNPSHLEIVAPVVEGSVRARQRRRKDKTRAQVLPLIIHGDAAMAGQGVVMETFNLSQARGYATGGTVHIVVNNQVGFTTSNPLDARSTLYCTDVAKVVQAPVFHVNGDDPEAVCFIAKLAADYRAAFHKDVVIDFVCYRRHGHNEADEPSATQPLMYKIIKSLPPIYKKYGEQLLASQQVDDGLVKQYLLDCRAALDAGENLVKTVDTPPDELYSVDWGPYLKDTALNTTVETAVPKAKVAELAQKLAALPEGFVLQAQVKKMMLDRDKMTAGELPLNWGYAETMAYATLLDEGYPVRLSGQDSGRGTFAHRHAALHDQNTGEVYYPLNNINKAKASFICIDSVLSEEAVLAYEYGYTTADPNVLTLWEAQFGDFANGAQVVVDQFLSSGEQKWDRYSGLVMLLPHGYESMGPEHSSARLERYLQLCAQNNMSVCVPTTPAQVFHMLRRQMLRKVRKPLIVMSPKSFLRHPLAVSTLDELSEGEFKLMLPEVDDLDKNKVEKIILCFGKVYYALLEKRRENKQNDTAIIRVEQLYPFPREELLAVLDEYPNAKTVVWCQEEPMNQGAWYQISYHLRGCTVDRGRELDYVGRSAAAAPASGSAKRDKAEQKALVAAALA
jgi:2-oxoglutarate dehydrogenase E1 component